MDLISWPTENLQDELKAIESELLRIETFSERIREYNFKTELDIQYLTVM